MRLFTLNEVCRVTGQKQQNLRNWIALGYIRPVKYGRTGKGCGHGFSLVQIMAIKAGLAYKAEGANGERWSGVVRFLSGLTQERMEADFERGLTFPVPASLIHAAAEAEGLPDGFWIPGMLVEPPLDAPGITQAAKDLMIRLDLPTIYNEVKKRTERVHTVQVKV